MIEIKMTEEIRPIMEPFLFMVKAFNPDYEINQEQGKGQLSQKRLTPKEFLKDDMIYLNDADIELLMMLLNRAVNKEPMDIKIAANYIKSRNCVICGNRYKRKEFVKDISTEDGRKSICKKCFNEYIKEKYHLDEEEARRVGRSKHKSGIQKIW